MSYSPTTSSFGSLSTTVVVFQTFTVVEYINKWWRNSKTYLLLSEMNLFHSPVLGFFKPNETSFVRTSFFAWIPPPTNQWCIYIVSGHVGASCKVYVSIELQLFEFICFVCDSRGTVKFGVQRFSPVVIVNESGSRIDNSATIMIHSCPSMIANKTNKSESGRTKWYVVRGAWYVVYVSRA